VCCEKEHDNGLITESIGVCMRAGLPFVVLVFWCTASLHAQSSIPPYHTQDDFLLASPGALQVGLHGYDNPALLSYQHQADLLFTFSDASGKWSELNRWGLFFGAPNFGFGVIRQKTDAGSVADYRISASFGDRSSSGGISFGWSAGDNELFHRSSVVKAGTLFRPVPYLSFGLIGTKALSKGDVEGVVDVAVRPLGRELVTAFADYALQSAQSLNNGAWSAGVVLEALPGVRVTGRYFDTKAFTVGFQFSLGHAGLSSQAHYDQDGQHVRNTYGLRLGAFDRNVFNAYAMKRKQYAELNLFGPIGYQRYQIFDNTKTLSDLLAAMEAARSDSAVAGIAISTSGMVVGKEVLWELREKLKEFKSSGKKVVIFIDRANLTIYHFASVADKIVMDPVGLLSLEGFAAGRTFFKGTLEKLGIGYDEWRFFKYKSAAEVLSREKMSDADREQRQKLVDDEYNLVKSDVCAARGIARDRFDRLVNEDVVFMPRQALERGLVDTLARWDAARALIAGWEGEEKRFVDPASLGRFQLPPDDRWGERPRIAVIYALGACAMDDGITARKLVKTVQAAVEDSRVRAIVLRVDSPGGDGMASDYIAEELKKARGRKPIIISQGQVAASGGYWLSMYGDTIVAAPSTVTGSIGVIGGWMYNKGLKEWMGFSTDVVKAGEHADLGFGFVLPLLGLGLPDRNLTAEERGKVETVIKSFYKDFVTKVATGRKKSQEEIESIAEGRVWSGIDGKEKGLVDVLGGLETAINIARDRAGIPGDQDVTRVEMPGKGLFDPRIFVPKLFGGDDQIPGHDLLEQLKFRLKHNGEPLPMLPWEEMDLTAQ
jgi:protease IV